MKKTIKILLGIILTIIAVFVLVIIGLNIFFKISFNEFYASAEKEFKIPGLSDVYTPQGITLCEDGTFLSCGYMKDGGASRIYVIGDDELYVNLIKEDGSQDSNHAGGLAVYGDYIYLTNEEYISIYQLDTVLNAASGDTATPVDQFYIGLHSAFVYVDDSKLYVGEFYREENYPTAQSHHMQTDTGDMHYAILAVFELSESTEYGFVSSVPEYVYSITGLAQGLCVTDAGSLCISTSYGISYSNIFVYEDPAGGEADGLFEIAGASVPLYFLDHNHLTKTVKLFPMSEELISYGGNIYIMCESACNKYVFGKLTGNNYVYSFPVQ